jgi:hypothetical protein
MDGGDESCDGPLEGGWVVRANVGVGVFPVLGSYCGWAGGWVPLSRPEASVALSSLLSPLSPSDKRGTLAGVR